MNNRIYFFDVETVSSKDIVQIGITRLTRTDDEVTNIEIVFDAILNPIIKSCDVNPFAARAHHVSEYKWSKAPTIEEYYIYLKILLENEKVMHWGGNDPILLSKTLTNFELDEFEINFTDMIPKYFKKSTLSAAAKEIGIENSAFHDASFDTYISALLFAAKYHKYALKTKDQTILKTYNEKYEGNANPNKLKEMYSKASGEKGNICLSGFTASEKIKFGKLLSDQGYCLKKSVSKKLHFLILPNREYRRSPSKEKMAKEVGAKIVDFDTFLSIHT